MSLFYDNFGSRGAIGKFLSDNETLWGLTNGPVIGRFDLNGTYKGHVKISIINTTTATVFKQLKLGHKELSGGQQWLEITRDDAGTDLVDNGSTDSLIKLKAPSEDIVGTLASNYRLEVDLSGTIQDGKSFKISWGKEFMALIEQGYTEFWKTFSSVNYII